MNENDFRLYHHGILGMHWGIRRFQNPDGSLTEAGRRRYNVGDAAKSVGKAAKRAVDKNMDWSQNAINSYARLGKSAYNKASTAIKNQAEKQRQEDTERRERNQQTQKERANEKDRKSGNRNTSTLNEARKKDINELSNKELREYNNRLKLEKEFASYTKSNRRTGAQWAAGVATVALTTIATNALVNSGESFISGFAEGFIDSIG